MARKDLLAVAHVFTPAPARDDNDEFLDRLRLPATPRREEAADHHLTARPKVIAFRDDTPPADDQLARLEQRIAEMSAQIGELTITVDELRETIAGFQEELPPARWRIPLRANKP